MNSEYFYKVIIKYQELYLKIKQLGGKLYKN